MLVHYEIRRNSTWEIHYAVIKSISFLFLALVNFNFNELLISWRFFLSTINDTILEIFSVIMVVANLLLIPSMKEILKTDA